MSLSAASCYELITVPMFPLMAEFVIATPTEAAGSGAFGARLIALLRAARTTCMIILGARIYSAGLFIIKPVRLALHTNSPRWL